MINGTDVKASINSAFNRLNTLSSDISNLNDYIKSVDDARVADFNTLKELIKKLHGL